MNNDVAERESRKTSYSQQLQKKLKINLTKEVKPLQLNFKDPDERNQRRTQQDGKMFLGHALEKSIPLNFHGTCNNLQIPCNPYQNADYTLR